MANQKLSLIITGVDRASGPLSTVAGGIERLGKRAAQAAIAGIAAMTAGIVKLSSEAASLQAIEDSFMDLAQTATRSGDKMLFSLREASNQMISNTELMKLYNQATGLVSEQFANELPDAMEYLGRISASTGKDMGYLVESLVTGVGRLSIQWLDNLQVMVNAEKVYKEWAATNGKSVSEMTKAEKQMAFMGEAMTQLKEKTKGMTSLVDPFQQLKTILINLKDRIAKAIGPTVLGFFSDLAEEIEDFVSGDRFHEWIKTSVKWLKDRLIPALKDGVAIIKGWIDKLMEVTPEQWENAAAIAETAIKVLALVWALDKLIVVFQALQAFSRLGVFTGIAKAATTAAGVSGVGGVAGLTASFGGLAASIGAVMLPLLPLIAALGALFFVVKHFGADAWKSITMLWDIARIKLYDMGIEIGNVRELIGGFHNEAIDSTQALTLATTDMIVPFEDFAAAVKAAGKETGETNKELVKAKGSLDSFLDSMNDWLGKQNLTAPGAYVRQSGQYLRSHGWTFDDDTGWAPPSTAPVSQPSPQQSPLSPQRQQQPITINFNAPVLGFTDEYELAQKLAPVLARVQR